MGDDLVLDRSVFLGMSLAAQAEYYAENGFVLLPSVLEVNECNRILNDMEEIAAQHEDWKFAFDYQGLAYGTQYEGAYGSWPPRSIEQLIANPTVLASTVCVPPHPNPSRTHPPNHVVLTLRVAWAAQSVRGRRQVLQGRLCPQL